MVPASPVFLRLQCANKSPGIQLKMQILDLPGGPVVKTSGFHWKGHGFSPWSGKFSMLRGTARKEKMK